MLPAFINVGRKYADFAWNVNAYGASKVDSLPSWGLQKRKKTMPSRTPKRGNLRGTNLNLEWSTSRKRARTTPSLRGSVTASSMSTSTSTTQPERTVRHISTQVRCLDKDKEGANEYVHTESSARTGTPLPYKVLEQLIAPTWSEKVTNESIGVTVGANTESMHEFLIMDRNFVLARLKKAVSVSPLASLIQANPFMATSANLDAPNVQVQQLVKFEGGRFRYRFINTCSNTIHFEFRQMKLSANNLLVGARPSTRSPLSCFQIDQGNTTEFGDLPFPVQSASSLNPQNTDRLSGWSMSNPVEVTNAESVSSNQLRYGGLIATATLPAFKRPQRSSPTLHQVYDKLGSLKIKLKPGDTFVYDIRINPFTCNGALGFNQAVNFLIQYYSRVLWVFARGEFNIDNTNANSMAPGPCAFTMVSEHELHWKAVPRVKSNNFYEESKNTATLGPFTDISNANATTMDVSDIHEENYNTAT